MSWSEESGGESGSRRKQQEAIEVGDVEKVMVGRRSGVEGNLTTSL